MANKTAEDKVLLLKLHPCSRGLSDEAINEVAEAAEYLRCKPGDVVSSAGEPLQSIYLVIHGRLRIQVVDLSGDTVVQRFQMAGGQFGGLAASVAEPTPVHCIAEDPSVLLRIDYTRAVELSQKYQAFRANYLRLISNSVKQALFNGKAPVRPSLVAFMHQADDTRVVSGRVLNRLAELGESVCVFSDRAEEQTHVRHRPVLAADPGISPEEIWRQAGEWRQTGRAVFDVETTVDPARASQGFETCEHVFWCVTPTNWESSIDRLQAIEAEASGWRDKISIVWLLRSGEDAPVASDLRAMAGRDFKVSLGRPGAHQGTLALGGIERLVHLLRGVQIGVALGGGAARGMAHLGVLKALQQSGIPIDRIAGTSAGAMTGVMCAAGFDPDYLVQRFVTDLRPSWWFRCLSRGDQWYLLYKYRSGQFDPMLRKYLGDRHIEQLPIPVHAITVDLISGRAVVRESGDAVHAILESINLPVLSTPINRDGESLVDGGIMDNVPADVLTQQGCNFVIAVSVTAKMEGEFAGNRADTPADQMRPASAIQTLLRSYLVQSHSLNAFGVQPADFVIEPDVTRFELSDFTRTDELAAIGERATLEAIPEIRRLLNQFDSALFPLAEGSTPSADEHPSASSRLKIGVTRAWKAPSPP